MRNLTLALAASAAAISTGLQAQESEATYDAEITRTTFNIPHIKSDSWQGVGYGVAYAYAQDNICMIAEEFATVAGERSLHFGPENKVVLGFRETDNVTSDIFYRSQIDLPALRAGLAKTSLTSQQLIDGYVAGYNRFLRDHGGEKLPDECRGKGYVRAITKDDMLRLNEKQMLLASSLAVAPGIAGATPPGGEAPTDTAAVIIPGPDDARYGSNGWAFGSETTADGRGLVIGNPHFPWEGPARFWQLHITGPEGFDVMGVGIAGTPFPTLGFNKDVAWTHTVTAARHFTIYSLTLAEGDSTSYIVDGEAVKMDSREITVPMPRGTEPVTRTLYSTQFGPVVALPGTPLGWSEGTAYAIRDANTGNQRAIDTWLRIGQAKNVGEIETAISETLGIPWVNTIAADRNGNALHADITAVPNTPTEFITACSTPVSGLVANLVTLLDGTRAECDWRANGDGLLPADQQASRTRQDYVTNSNDSYWISNPRKPYAQLSPILGKFEQALTLRSRSNFTETEALIRKTKIDHSAAKELVFGNKSLAADMVVDGMLEECGTKAGLAEACDALSKWDKRFNTDSRAAYLFVVFWNKVRDRRDLWDTPFNPAEPVSTPAGFTSDSKVRSELYDALIDAGAELTEAGIALDAPWGEVQVRIDSDDAIPVHGGPGTAGVLNMQRSRPIEGAITPVHGSSYIQIVGFDEEGPVADAILSYSQSTNPASPHYADQTRMYAKKEWNRLPFTPEEIEAQKTGETIRISE